MTTKKAKIQLGRAARQSTLESANPILLAGEPVIALDTGVLKIGDGVSAYTQLPEIGSSPDLSDYVTETELATELAGYEENTNKVTSLSSSSTDNQYPSAKCVYDLVGNVESLLNNINSGS